MPTAFASPEVREQGVRIAHGNFEPPPSRPPSEPFARVPHHDWKEVSGDWIVAVVASVTVLSLVFSSILPVRAAVRNDGFERLAGSAVNSNPRPVAGGTTSVVDPAVRGISAHSPEELLALRAKLQKAADSQQDISSKLPQRLARRADQLKLALTLVDIAIASPSQRRALIRALPVTIVDAPATDGREGVYRSFVAGGKVRGTMFVPNHSRRGTVVPSTDSVAEQPDGSGTRTESGPRDRADLCYDEEFDVWEECATEQEIEDAWIVHAALQEEQDQQEQDYEDLENEISNWCANNPGQCYFLPDGSAAQECSGPSPNSGGAIPQCVEQVGMAALEIGGAVGKRVSLYNKLATGARIATGVLAWKVALATAAAGGVAFALAAAINCVAQAI